MKNDALFGQAQKMADVFAENEGRRPRIMIAEMSNREGQGIAAKVIAFAYADLGFDVDIAPRLKTPVEAAKQAIENDVHVLNISALDDNHKTWISELMTELKNYGRANILVTLNGAVPKRDYGHLYKAGVFAIFGPETRISAAAIQILKNLSNPL